MITTPILSFRDEYAWLSNFYPHPAWCRRAGELLPTAEHAFQAMKSEYMSDAHGAEFIDKLLVTKSAKVAKQLGRKYPVDVERWDNDRIENMRLVLFGKFTEDNELGHQLVDTNPRMLVEGNTWNDTFWGYCRGRGSNLLGVLLMERRTKLS